MRKIFLLILINAVGGILLAQQVHLSVALTGFANGTKFYLTDPEIQTDIDSAVMKNNSLLMKGNLSHTPKWLRLYATAGKEFFWCNLFVGDEKVLVKGDISDFPFHLKIIGSKSQDIYNKLESKTGGLYAERDNLTRNIGRLLADESDSAKAVLNSIVQQLNHIDSATDSIRLSFIKSNLNSYAALHELYFLRTKFSKDSLQSMYNALHPDYKESVYGQRIENYLKVGNILNVGDLYSDFEGVDQYGKSKKLSDFVGKYILLDFTQTYCGPCLLSVQELKETFRNHADSLNVISFCADRSKNIWKLGLERDKPDWPSLWDGKGYYGETILKYGVQGYPTFFIINPQGRIISKWSGYGKGGIIKQIKEKIKIEEDGM